MGLDPGFWARQALLFGQAREDAETERWLMKRHGRVQRAMVVASGGCTALSLADVVGERLDAVDINPQQVVLSVLKRRALTRLDRGDFLNFLETSASRFAGPLSEFLTPAESDLLDAIPRGNGLHRAGRVDRRMAFLRRLLNAGVHSKEFVRDFLQMDDLDAQTTRFDREWDTARWRFGTSAVLNKWALRLGFGKSAAASLPASFDQFMRAKVKSTLTRFPCADNGCAWQLLMGEYGSERALPRYATASGFVEAVRCAERIRFECDDVRGWLDRQDAGSLDFISLSNILELADVETRMDLLRSASRAAASGAMVCLRGILPLTVLPEVCGRLVAANDLTRACGERDRSMVCNEFKVYLA